MSNERITRPLDNAAMLMDKFIRLPAYETFDLQYKVALEDMVRENYGKIHSEKFILRFNEESVKVETFMHCYEDIRHSVPDSVYFHGRNEYCICSKDLVMKFEFASVEEYSEDEDMPATAIPVETGANDFVEVWLFHVIGRDTSFLEDIFAKHSFIKASTFSARAGRVPVTFAFPTDHGPRYATQSFMPIKLTEIEDNYSREVVAKAKDFIAKTKEVSHGIFLINGPVGTGKSYLIRSIITELKNRRAVVCSPPTEFLVNAGLLTSVATNFKRSLLVFEDVGEVVAIDSASRFEDARANLLNLSEGLLSLLLDGIIIISFNYSMDKIDPAILRPGRCLSHISVGNLPYEQACKMVDFDIHKREYSLAEIYEMRRTGSAIEPAARKVGFVQ
jgi:hypothetical protein